MKELTSWLEVTGMLLFGLGVTSGIGMLLPHLIGLSVALALFGAYLIGVSAVVSGWRPRRFTTQARITWPGRISHPAQPVDQSNIPRNVA